MIMMLIDKMTYFTAILVACCFTMLSSMAWVTAFIIFPCVSLSHDSIFSFTKISTKIVEYTDSLLSAN